ncbi:Hypothetical protein D9617_3g018790 [Elsinoe fawcettii]|nr:Hypothetical protein D9617_3g018790 [Elsinoe fawcettii]
MATSIAWSVGCPVVLRNASLTRVLDDLISHTGACTTLVICCSRDDFTHLLLDAIVEDSKQTAQHGTSDDPIDIEMSDTDHDGDEGAIRRQIAEHTLLQPTLYMLTSAANLKVAFCPTTPHTLAYLASLCLKHEPSNRKPPTPGQRPLLAILNPISQHEGTRSYSAQGLTKFFSAAVSTADDTGAKLVVAECRTGQGAEPLFQDDLFAETTQPAEGSTSPSPWDEQVAITNVKAKGAASRDFSWQNRTVSIREVAEKWCDFV